MEEIVWKHGVSLPRSMLALHLQGQDWCPDSMGGDSRATLFDLLIPGMLLVYLIHCSCSLCCATFVFLSLGSIV